ncbi:hypothetical protein BC834DRAFT_896190 [Gloeopeniophorella convolvens]|nr:hypothetical protein BC834DRAFT_896190 [Gloeopeniophorella convolvens]
MVYWYTSDAYWGPRTTKINWCNQYMKATTRVQLRVQGALVVLTVSFASPSRPPCRHNRRWAFLKHFNSFALQYDLRVVYERMGPSRRSGPRPPTHPSITSPGLALLSHSSPCARSTRCRHPAVVILPRLGCGYLPQKMKSTPSLTSLGLSWRIMRLIVDLRTIRCTPRRTYSSEARAPFSKRTSCM